MKCVQNSKLAGQRGNCWHGWPKLITGNILEDAK